jgi:hypothetical protein
VVNAVSALISAVQVLLIWGGLKLIKRRTTNEAATAMITGVSHAGGKA